MRRLALGVVATLLASGCGAGSGRAPDAEPSALARERTVTLVYGGDREVDLYLPPDATQAPVVVVLHGITSDASPKDFPGIVAWGERLAERGLAVAVPNYRADPAAGPAALADVRSVLDRLDEVAPRYGLDTRRLGLLGFSGGGPTLVRAAYDGARPVSAVVGYYALVDAPGSPPEQSLHRRRAQSAAAREVPVLLAVGCRDRVPGVQQSVERVRRLDPRPADVTVLVHPTGDHGFDAFQSDDPATRRIVARTVDWLVARLGGSG